MQAVGWMWPLGCSLLTSALDCHLGLCSRLTLAGSTGMLKNWLLKNLK